MFSYIYTIIHNFFLLFNRKLTMNSTKLVDIRSLTEDFLCNLFKK